MTVHYDLKDRPLWLKGVRYDLKTHPRVMKILVLTIFGVLSSKM